MFAKNCQNCLTEGEVMDKNCDVYFMKQCISACYVMLVGVHTLQVTMHTDQTISSSDWRMSVPTSQHLPCGTTHCVVSIQVMYLRKQLCLCIAKTTCRRLDTSSSNFRWLTTTWTSVRLKSSQKVCDNYTQCASFVTVLQTEVCHIGTC